MTELCHKCGTPKEYSGLPDSAGWCPLPDEDCRIKELEWQLERTRQLARENARYHAELDDARKEAISERDEARSQVLALREALERALRCAQRFHWIGDAEEALANTSATAHQAVERIEREAQEKAIQRLNSSVGVTWRIPDDLAIRIRAAILGEKEKV